VRVLTPEEVDALVDVISQSDLQSAQVAMARFQREALSHLVVVLATRLVAARTAASIHDEAAVAAEIEKVTEPTPERDNTPSSE
jgi:hypothetical protein